MIIQNNLSADNARNAFNKNTKFIGKSTEKLSSGYRINRACDDAAGLVISEKLRALSKSGFAVNADNIEKGLGLLSVADGAMSELHAITNRMRELAVQSANGTYTDETDRQSLNKELQDLKSEISRIVGSTEFNGIKVFEGQENIVKIGSPAKTFGDVDFGSDFYQVFQGYNDVLTFRYNNEQYSITIPPKSRPDAYTKNEIVNELNNLFENVLGPEKLTVSLGDPELGESQNSLVYDSHGGIFDSFGGVMMRKGNFYPVDGSAASSVISDNFLQGGTTVAAIIGKAYIANGVNIIDNENNLSFVLQGDGGGNVSIDFETGFHTANSIVDRINNYFNRNNMSASASMRSGYLHIERTLGGTENRISGLVTGGAYDVLLREYNISTSSSYNRSSGTTSKNYVTVNDPANPPDNVVEENGTAYIPPSGGNPTIPNPNYGNVTGSVPSYWYYEILQPGETVSQNVLGKVITISNAKENPKIIETNLKLNQNGKPSSYSFNQTLSGNYNIVDGLNDTFSFKYGEKTINVNLSGKSYSSSELAVAISSQISSHGISCKMSGGKMTFDGDGDSDNFTDTFSGFSGDLLNFVLVSNSGSVSEKQNSSGHSSEEATGTWTVTEKGFFQGSKMPNDIFITEGVNDILKFNLNGQDIAIDLNGGKYSQNEILNQIKSQTIGYDVEISIENGALKFTNLKNELINNELPSIRLDQSSSAVTTLFKTSPNAAGSSVNPQKPQYIWEYKVDSYETIDTNTTIGNSNYNPGNGNSLKWIPKDESQRYTQTSAHLQRSSLMSGYNFKNPMIINSSNDVLKLTVTDPNNIKTDYEINLTHGTYTANQMYNQLNIKLSAISDCLVQMTGNNSNLRIETTNKGSGWSVALTDNNAFRELYSSERRIYGIAPQIIAPSKSDNAESEGRVNLTSNPITNIVKGVNDVLEFDLNIDGVVKRYKAVIEEGSYDKNDLIPAMNRAIENSGAKGVRAELKSVNTGLDGHYETTTLIYTPTSTGTAVIEGVGGSAAYSVFYRGVLEDHLIIPEKIKIKVGPHMGDELNYYVIDVPIEMYNKSLNIDNINIENQEQANETVEVIDKAISYITKKRVKSGADYNALEMTFNNVINQNENLTSAESQIRNLDMAKEMVTFTKYNILQQVSQAVLSQAQTKPQGVLNLLAS